MSEEILGAAGNALVEEVLAEVGIETLSVVEEERMKKKEHKKTVYFDKEFIERMLAEAMTQLSNQLNTLFLIFHDKETQKTGWDKSAAKMKAIKGSYNIMVNELETICHCLEPYAEAALKPKHRAVRCVCNEGLRRLSEIAEGLNKAKNLNHSAVIKFGVEITLLLTNFHTVFHEKTPSKERKRIVKEYCD